MCYHARKPFTRSDAVLSGTHTNAQIHPEIDAGLNDGDDDDMAFGRSHTQMVDT